MVLEHHYCQMVFGVNDIDSFDMYRWEFQQYMISFQMIESLSQEHYWAFSHQLRTLQCHLPTLIALVICVSCQIGIFASFYIVRKPVGIQSNSANLESRHHLLLEQLFLFISSLVAELEIDCTMVKV